MLLIKGISENAYFNLASEEYLADNFSEDIFYLWQNDNAVIIGKNQNAYSEIDLSYAEAHGIKVVRRLTGGGAVFHDNGNLNYTVIEKNDEESFGNYEKFSKTVIAYLKTLGVDAELSGRNDLLADGKKISGNAQCVRKGKIIHHGTLLFSSDLSRLSDVLRVNPLKLVDKGIKSVKSRVANISDLTDKVNNITDFANGLYEYIKQNGEDVTEYAFTEEDVSKTEQLVKEKYGTREWNYGYISDYGFKNSKKTAGGIVELELSVEKGVVERIRISGDFFGKRDLSELEAMIVGTPHERAEISKKLLLTDISQYISGVSADELLDIFF
ncbi:MAG: lipoate--protein ligase [Clostridia bacterium]|nr:lipoate--protein ligase [Clostridia bacterium]